eukprot:3439612-Pyramimonas_sp.AAC.1
MDHAFHNVEPLGHELIAGVREEDAPLGELHVITQLRGLEGSPKGHEEQRVYIERPLDAEMLRGQVVRPFVVHGRVEGSILLVCDVLRLAQPDRRVLVEL